jgi:leader peptidase (prepilin peptidase)/N-methyltransferase
MRQRRRVEAFALRDGLEAMAAAAALGIPAGWLARRVAAGFEAPRAPPPILVMILAGVAAFAWAALVVPSDWTLAASLVLAWTLICLAAVDAVAFRLPDALTLPLLAAGLAVSLGLPGPPIFDHLVGAAAGYLVLAALAWVWRRWRGVEGIGMGDAKLLAASGAWLGWRPLPSVVVIACAVALTWILVLAAARREFPRGTQVAFGVPLSLATWIVWLYGPLIG